MRRLIAALQGLRSFLERAALCLRYMRRLNYSFHLAWLKAAR